MLPTLNAILNITGAVLLLFAFYQIKQKNIARHRAAMLSATVVAVLFLTSYLIYHYQTGTTYFQGSSWTRIAYLAILLSHTILAVVNVPMVIVTLKRGLGMNVTQHRKIAKWTFPIWLYVSVTGVIIYTMLYLLDYS